MPHCAPEGLSCVRFVGDVMRYTCLLCVLLSGCSVLADNPLPIPVLPPSHPPSHEAVRKGIDSLVKEAKLTLPVEISTIRKTDHGPGEYFLCLREAHPGPEKKQLLYAVFFDNDVYKDSRISVILEACEVQQYTLSN